MAEFTFGKYKGQKVMDIFDTDRNYCTWVQSIKGPSKGCSDEGHAISRFIITQNRVNKIEEMLSKGIDPYYNLVNLQQSGEEYFTQKLFDKFGELAQRRVALVEAQ